MGYTFKKHFQTIMLVDDNPIDLMINEELIKLNNLSDRVIPMQNPNQAIAHLERTFKSPSMMARDMPDLILLDVDMPEMDGFAFLDKLASMPDEMTEGLDVVVMSSSDHYIEKMKARQDSFVKGFIPKPFNINKFKPAVEELIIAH